MSDALANADKRAAGAPFDRHISSVRTKKNEAMTFLNARAQTRAFVELMAPPPPLSPSPIRLPLLIGAHRSGGGGGDDDSDDDGDDNGGGNKNFGLRVSNGGERANKTREAKAHRAPTLAFARTRVKKFECVG